MIVTVTIGDLWLDPLGDEDAGMLFGLNSLTVAPQRQGEIREYGNGRYRYVSTPGRVMQAAITLICDTRDQVQFIEDYQGEPVWVRDPKGRKFAGIYLDPSIPERAGLEGSFRPRRSISRSRRCRCSSSRLAFRLRSGAQRGPQPLQAASVSSRPPGQLRQAGRAVSTGNAW